MVNQQKREPVYRGMIMSLACASYNEEEWGVNGGGKVGQLPAHLVEGPADLVPTPALVLGAEP